ncbi:MAG: hypothetical protein KatS3mg102_0101 [Planctomycetota bacterium]|nr:MAG: hypothetical protein KatS3mg102_0101 [Planctomycetota bacterium]
MTPGLVPPRRVLLGVACTDQGELAGEPAFEQALWLARRAGAALELVHVLEGAAQPAASARAGAAAGALEALLGAALERWVERARQQGVGAEATILHGRPSVELVRHAIARGHELVVVAARRHTLLERLVHGLTARQLMRLAPMPVWSVHPDSRPGLRRVLVAVDLSPVSALCLATGRMLCELAGAELHVLHCVSYPLDFALRREPDAEAEIARYHAEVLEGARAALEQLLGAEGARAAIHLAEGKVEQAVARLIAEWGIDLVVMGTAARTGLAGLLMGNTAERLVERVEGSFWVCKPEGFVSPLAAATAPSPSGEEAK